MMFTYGGVFHFFLCFIKLTKDILFHCFGVRFVPTFSKESQINFPNDQKSRENRTNMDIILLFLAKPLDKHGYHTSEYHLSALESHVDVRQRKDMHHKSKTDFRYISKWNYLFCEPFYIDFGYLGISYLSKKCFSTDKPG